MTESVVDRVISFYIVHTVSQLETHQLSLTNRATQFAIRNAMTDIKTRTHLPICY